MSTDLLAAYATQPRQAEPTAPGLYLADDGYVYQLLSDGRLFPVTATSRVLAEDESVSLFDNYGNNLLSVGPNQPTMITVPEGQALKVSAVDGGELLSVSAGGGTEITLREGQMFTIKDSEGRILFGASDDGVGIVIVPGGKCGVADVNQNLLFGIEEDGSLHGKTGRSLVFDLP